MSEWTQFPHKNVKATKLLKDLFIQSKIISKSTEIVRRCSRIAGKFEKHQFCHQFSYESFEIQRIKCAERFPSPR